METTILPVLLPSGVTMQVQAAAPRGEQDIAANELTFETAAHAIEGIATVLADTLKRVNPHKANVEFELDFAVESGQLTALFVKGKGSGTLKISLEWDMSQTAGSNGSKRA